MNAPTLRARVRAEMMREIKEAARRRLAAEGANLSLRAIARELGMVSSAIYRYVPSRDDLLTSLIIDAYDAVGDAAERADAACERTDPMGRFMGVCHAVREWALAHPHEYALIYGSPVPDYRAPADTVQPAIRVGRALATILSAHLAAGAATGEAHRAAAEKAHGAAEEAHGATTAEAHEAASGATAAGADGANPAGEPPLPETVRADMARLIGHDGFPAVPEEPMARGVAAWVHLFGLVSFELFGHLDGVVVDRAAFFDHQMRAMAHHAGL